jgi:hypothetical protein
MAISDFCQKFQNFNSKICEDVFGVEIQRGQNLTNNLVELNFYFNYLSNDTHLKTYPGTHSELQWVCYCGCFDCGSDHPTL